MAVMDRDTRTSLDYEFEWTGSGAHTFIHNFSIPLRQNRRAANVSILIGDAYVTAINENDFSITVATTPGKGLFKPAVNPNDYSEAV
jgi:hypothetical protein